MSGAWIAAFAALWVLTLLLGFAVLGLFRRFGAVLEAAEERLGVAGELGAPVRSRVADFQLYDARGQVALSRDAITVPTLLLFVEPGCEACRVIADQLIRIGAAIDEVPFAVVIEDSRRGRAFEFPPDLRVLYQRHGDVFRVFRNRATPQAYVVDDGGLVLARLVPESVDDLRDMARFQQEGGDAARRSLSAASVSD